MAYLPSVCHYPGNFPVFRQFVGITGYDNNSLFMKKVCFIDTKSLGTHTRLVLCVRNIIIPDIFDRCILLILLIFENGIDNTSRVINQPFHECFSTSKKVDSHKEGILSIIFIN